MRDPLPGISDTPDHVRVLSRLELTSRPIRFETLNDFVDLVRVRRDHSIVAGFGEIFRLPVERHDPGGVIVDHHGLLMRQLEAGATIDHFDPCGAKLLATFVVLFFAVAARRVQHDTHLDAPPVGFDHCLQNIRIGKHEHLDAKGCFGVIDRIENGAHGIVGQYHQISGHKTLLPELRFQNFVKRAAAAGAQSVSSRVSLSRPQIAYDATPRRYRSTPSTDHECRSRLRCPRRPQ